ncbi:MAG: hypothetical protein NW224_00560 [Leptolyngbyaceae cyanobacterium bins.302]|nr:hypothetical protein [Leptolyngbyaceae cyanobacterium bins.302]
MIPIDTSLLRLTWSVIEETQTSSLLSLTDTGLVRLLLQRISRRILLSGEEVYLLYDYISSKITLIRDMAESRFIYQSPSVVMLNEPGQTRPSIHNSRESMTARDIVITHL